MNEREHPLPSQIGTHLLSFFISIGNLVLQAWEGLRGPSHPLYRCADCAAWLPGTAYGDRSGGDICTECRAHPMSRPVHLRLTEEPIEGGLLLRWRFPSSEHRRRFLYDLGLTAAPGYGFALAFLFAIAHARFPTTGCHLRDTTLPPWPTLPPLPTPLLSPGVALALLVGPLVLALVYALFMTTSRFSQRAEVRVVGDALLVAPSPWSAWSRFVRRYLGITLRTGRVVSERGATRIPIPIPVRGHREARYVVRQIESAMRRVVAHRQGYRG